MSGRQDVAELDPLDFGYPPGAGDKAQLKNGHVPIDAVAVCCNTERPLFHAVELAAALDCPLVLYQDVSRKTTRERAYDAAVWSLQVPLATDVSTFYIPVRRDEPKPWPPLRTWKHCLASSITCGGLCDLRTMAMTDAFLAGCRRLLMVDDDVSVDPQLVLAASRAMRQGSYAAVGFRVTDIPDRSVFDHLFALDKRLEVEAFKEHDWIRPPSGGAVLLDPSQCVAHSPPIYNEDWVVFLEMLRRGHRVAVMGKARQHGALTFHDARIRAQTAGEIFAEGLTFAANHKHSPLDKDLWQRSIRVRLSKLAVLKHLVNIIDDRAWMSTAEPGFPDNDSPVKNRPEIMKTISLVERCFRDLRPGPFVEFYKRWAHDEQRFQTWLTEQPARSLAHDAPPIPSGRRLNEELAAVGEVAAGPIT